MKALLRGWILGTVLVGVAAGGALAQGATFSGPPVLGDRKISWEWQAIPGLDPYFLGNSVLRLHREQVAIPVPGRLRMLRAGLSGDFLYGIGDQDNRVYIFRSADGSAVQTLAAPPAQINDLAIHGSEKLILAALQDGRVALWDLLSDTPTVPDLYIAQIHPCRHVRFFLRSTNPEERRFITGGDSDTVRVWAGPGSLLKKIATTGTRTTAMAVTQFGSLLAVGDPAGIIRIFEPTRGTILRRLDGHSAPILQMIFSDDQRRLISLDATGRIVRWNVAQWNQEVAIQSEGGEGLRIGLRQPDAALIYLINTEGIVRIYDGRDGRLYREADLVPEGTTSASLFGLLGRWIYTSPSEGVLRIHRTGFCTPSPEDPVCFAGYKIWRSETPHARDALLLRVFGFGDSTWAFSGDRRAFVDPDSMIPRGARRPDILAGPHNGMPYYYSITAFEKRYLNGAVFDVQLNSIEQGLYRSEPTGTPTPVRSHKGDRGVQPLLGNVIVVPNPYEAGKVPWDREIGEHIEFRNLPSQATIRIYSLAGDFVRMIEHAGGDFGEPTDARDWDLKNTRGEDVASGVYIYHVSTRLSSEERKGYFTIVR